METEVDMSQIIGQSETQTASSTLSPENIALNPETSSEMNQVDPETATFAPLALEGQQPQVLVMDAQGHQETLSLDDFKKKYGNLESARVFLGQWREANESETTGYPMVAERNQNFFLDLGLPLSMEGVSIVDATSQGVVLNMSGTLQEFSGRLPLQAMIKHLPGFEAAYTQAVAELAATHQTDNPQQPETPLNFPFPQFDSERLRISPNTDGRRQLTVSDGRYRMIVDQEHFAQWLQTQPENIQKRYQHLGSEGRIHRLARETLDRFNMGHLLTNPSLEYEAMVHRLNNENDPDQRAHLTEHFRQFFEGHHLEPMSRETIDQFRQRIMDADPQTLLDQYAGDQTFAQLVEQHVIGTNPDGTPQISLSLNEPAVDTLLGALAPDALMVNHGDSQFLRDMFSDVPQMREAFAGHDQFMESLPQMEQAVEQEIEAIGRKYNFKDIRTLPPEQRQAEAIRIATVLCQHIKETNKYDWVYAGDGEIRGVPARYQMQYEEAIVATQHRGMCTSFSSFYQRGLEHYGVNSILLGGINNPINSGKLTLSRHAFVGVQTSGYDSDSKIPRYHIFDPTDGHYGVGTGSFDYSIEQPIRTYILSTLGRQEYGRQAAPQMIEASFVNNDDFDQDLIEQIRHENPVQVLTAADYQQALEAIEARRLASRPQ